MMARVSPTDAFKLPRQVLTMTGVWPQERPSSSYRLRTFTSWFVSWGMFSCMAIDVFANLNDLQALSEVFYVMITYAIYLTKLMVFTLKRKTVLEVVKSLEDPVYTSHPEVWDEYMEMTVRASNLIQNTYIVLVIFLVLSCAIYPVLDGVPLPFPFPYDLGHFRLVMYGFQLVGDGLSAMNHILTDTFTLSCMGIVAAQFRILGKKIKYSPVHDDDALISHLKECVVHHLELMRFVELIESIYSVCLLVQLIGSAIVICNTLFQLILIPFSYQSAMLLLYLMIMVIQFFLWYWFGNEVILQSLAVGDACYKSNWICMSGSSKKYLFIIMERSKRPLQFTTMKFTVLSLTSFLTILRWSYSYLMLMLNFYYNHQK